MIGWFLFATHTTVFSGNLWYHIPRYLLLNFPGLKNPNAKLFPLEIKTSPSLMILVVFMESLEAQEMKRRIKSKEYRNNLSALIWASGHVLADNRCCLLLCGGACTCKQCRDDVFFALRAPLSLSGETTARGENGVLYSRKIYDYNDKESPPSIKVTRNLLVCESLG